MRILHNLAVALAACAANAPHPQPAAPAPPPLIAADLPVLSTCTGAPMYPERYGTKPLGLRVLGTQPTGAVLVQITPDGDSPRELRSTLAVEQRWLRLGFDADLVGDLVDPRTTEPAGSLRFMLTIRDNHAAMPSPDQILHGVPLLELTTSAGDSIPYALSCAAVLEASAA